MRGPIVLKIDKKIAEESAWPEVRPLKIQCEMD